MWPMLSRHGLMTTPAGYHKTTTTTTPVALVPAAGSSATAAATEKSGGASSRKRQEAPRAAGSVARGKRGGAKPPQYAAKVQHIVDRVPKFGLKGYQVSKGAAWALANIAKGLILQYADTMDGLLRETKKGKTFGALEAEAATRLIFSKSSNRLAKDLVEVGRAANNTELYFSAKSVKDNLKGPSKQRVGEDAVMYVSAVVESVVHDLAEVGFRYMARGVYPHKKKLTANYIRLGLQRYDYQDGLGEFFAGATLRGSSQAVSNPRLKKVVLYLMELKQKKGAKKHR